MNMSDMPSNVTLSQGTGSDCDLEDDHTFDERRVLIGTHGSLHSSGHSDPAPKDKYKFVYLIFYLLGVGTLLPWNMFITAKDYFMFQLRNTTAPDDLTNSDQTELQVSYESAVAIASMVPNIVMQLLNTLLAGKVSMSKRLISSMVVMLFMFAATLVFTKLDTSQWQITFYIVTICCVVIMCAASALLQSSLFGLAAQFPQAYTQAIMGGMGLGGVFAAVADIITKSIGVDVQTSAMWFFMCAVIVVLLALISYLLMYKLEYAKYHHNVYQKVLLESRSHGPAPSRASQYTSLIKTLWPYMMSVAIIFFVTLLVFPATTSNVQSVVAAGKRNIWQGKYWLDLYCFLLFNVGDLIGRTVAGFINTPRPKLIIPIISWLRVVFVPLFIMCNVQPRGVLPVVFQSDVAPIVVMAIFALTNGYLSTQALMVAPSLVKSDETELAGSAMSVCMTLGLSSGSLLSLPLVLWIKNI